MQDADPISILWMRNGKPFSYFHSNVSTLKSNCGYFESLFQVPNLALPIQIDIDFVPNMEESCKNLSLNVYQMWDFAINIYFYRNFDSFKKIITPLGDETSHLLVIFLSHWMNFACSGEKDKEWFMELMIKSYYLFSDGMGCFMNILNTFNDDDFFLSYLLLKYNVNQGTNKDGTIIPQDPLCTTLLFSIDSFNQRLKCLYKNENNSLTFKINIIRQWQYIMYQVTPFDRASRRYVPEMDEKYSKAYLNEIICLEYVCDYVKYQIPEHSPLIKTDISNIIKPGELIFCSTKEFENRRNWLFDQCGFNKLLDTKNIQYWRYFTIAGGAALYLICNAIKKYPRDLDIFIFKNGEEHVIQTLLKWIIEHFESRNQAYFKIEESGILTIINSTTGFKIQFIFTDKTSTESVLKSFDMDYVQCAYHEIPLMTIDAFVAIQSMCIYNSTKITRPMRYKKAIEKGFSITALPITLLLKLEFYNGILENCNLEDLESFSIPNYSKRDYVSLQNSNNPYGFSSYGNMIKYWIQSQKTFEECLENVQKILKKKTTKKSKVSESKQESSSLSPILSTLSVNSENNDSPYLSKLVTNDLLIEQMEGPRYKFLKKQDEAFLNSNFMFSGSLTDFISILKSAYPKANITLSILHSLNKTAYPIEKFDTKIFMEQGDYMLDSDDNEEKKEENTKFFSSYDHYLNLNSIVFKFSQQFSLKLCGQSYILYNDKQSYKPYFKIRHNLFFAYNLLDTDPTRIGHCKIKIYPSTEDLAEIAKYFKWLKKTMQVQIDDYTAEHVSILYKPKDRIFNMNTLEFESFLNDNSIPRFDTGYVQGIVYPQLLSINNRTTMTWYIGSVFCIYPINDKNINDKSNISINYDNFLN